jgi:hypothetical protein
MTGLDRWLKQATRHLSKDSSTQVRCEIQAHYDSAREAAMNNSATADEADRTAVAALGDAKVANCQYRRVLLTSAEAKVLGEGNWEARAVCSRSWLRRLGLATSVAALLGACAFFLTGTTAIAWTLVVGAIGIGFIFVAPLLPIYTPARGRVFRIVKWVVFLGILGMAFRPETLKWSWLWVSCLWPSVWIEIARASIRRKLPVGQWPKQLYL